MAKMQKGDILIPPYTMAINACPFCLEAGKSISVKNFDCGFYGYWQYDFYGNLTGAIEVLSPCINYGNMSVDVSTDKVDGGGDVKSAEKHKCYCDRDAVINFGCKCGGV